MRNLRSQWERAPEPEAAAGTRVVKDAHGNVLVDGDCVVLFKDLKLGGGSQEVKGGAKPKPIRLTDGDHEISCKMDGIAIGLKACYVKNAWRSLCRRSAAVLKDSRGALKCGPDGDQKCAVLARSCGKSSAWNSRAVNWGEVQVEWIFPAVI